jgi:hypothetical protein
MMNSLAADICDQCDLESLFVSQMKILENSLHYDERPFNDSRYGEFDPTPSSESEIRDMFERT